MWTLIRWPQMRCNQVKINAHVSIAVAAVPLKINNIWEVIISSTLVPHDPVHYHLNFTSLMLDIIIADLPAFYCLFLVSGPNKSYVMLFGTFLGTYLGVNVIFQNVNNRISVLIYYYVGYFPQYYPEWFYATISPVKGELMFSLRRVVGFSRVWLYHISVRWNWIKYHISHIPEI